MKIGLHELGPIAMKATRVPRINSTCTVFAGAELRDRLALGEKREDILAGLHRAIMLRAISIISRSGGVTNEFTFTGGVAKNDAAVRELHKLLKENYGDMTVNISPDSIYTGALGGAAFALRAVVTECGVLYIYGHADAGRSGGFHAAAYGARQGLRRAESQRAGEGRERSGVEAAPRARSLSA